jgi:hypothetical protein
MKMIYQPGSSSVDLWLPHQLGRQETNLDDQRPFKQQQEHEHLEDSGAQCTTAAALVLLLNAPGLGDAAQCTKTQNNGKKPTSCSKPQGSGTSSQPYSNACPANTAIACCHQQKAMAKEGSSCGSTWACQKAVQQAVQRAEQQVAVAQSVPLLQARLLQLLLLLEHVADGKRVREVWEGKHHCSSHLQDTHHLATT